MLSVSEAGRAIVFERRGPDGFAFNVRIFSSIASMPYRAGNAGALAKLSTNASLANEWAGQSSQMAILKRLDSMPFRAECYR